MRNTTIGAVSMAALLAAGLAACGQDRTDYAADETETERAADADMDRTDRYAQDDEAMRSDDQLAATEADPYADTTTQTQTTGAATQPGYGATDAAGTTTTTTIVSLDQIEERSDVERIANEAFDAADADGDGELSRTEYMTLALSALEYSGPSNLGLTGAQDMGEGDYDPNMTGQQAGVDQQGADPLDRPQPGASDPAMQESRMGQTSVAAADIDAAFNEAADEDGAITRESLREAFLARFDEADADNNEQLDAEERETFAQLIAGAETQPQD